MLRYAFMQPNHTNASPGSLGLLTRADLAAELQCSERHIQRLMARHTIPFIRISRKCVRFRREAVLNALIRREANPGL